MRYFWIQEVRYYKYLLILDIIIIICGIILLRDYQQKLENSGTIITIHIINNITYTIPIYKVEHSQTIYNMYDKCIFNNYQNCTSYTSNTFIYYEKINGFYIVSEMNYMSFYFSIFAFTFSIGMIICISFAYYDFYRLKYKESQISQKAKKMDIYIEEGEYPKSYLYD